MKIGIDLDDTIADTSVVMLEYAIKFDKEILKHSGVLKEVKDCNDYYYFARALNWNDQEVKMFFHEYYLEILKSVKPIKDVQKCLNKIHNMNNEIYIITSRREKKEKDIVENITRTWLEKNEICYNNLYINIIDKSEIINKNNIEIFIDDSYKSCEEVNDKTDAKTFLINTWYNEKIMVKDQITRINNLKEILDYIGGRYNE